MSERVAFIDSAKGALICLVVFGHVMGTAAKEGGLYDHLFAAIYQFHMPAFAMLAGLTFRHHNVWRWSVQAAVPYSLFMGILYIWSPERIGSYDWWFFHPAFALWFLVALCLWRITARMVLRQRYPVLLTLGTALGAGYAAFISEYFALSRYFFFFPAFIFGARHGCAIIKNMHKRWLQTLIVFIGILLLGFAFRQQIPLAERFGAFAYVLGFNAEMQSYAPIVRGLYILAGLATAVCFIALMPQHDRILAWLGRRSMGIYLLHCLAVLPNEEWFNSLHALGLLYAMSAYVAISAAIIGCCAVAAIPLQWTLSWMSDQIEGIGVAVVAQFSRTGNARSYNQLKQNA